MTASSPSQAPPRIEPIRTGAGPSGRSTSTGAEKLGSRQYSVPPIAVDTFKIAGTYEEHRQRCPGRFQRPGRPSKARGFRARFRGHLGRPCGRERCGLEHAVDVPEIRMARFCVQRDEGMDRAQRPCRGYTGGTLSVNLSAADIAAIGNGGDIPDKASIIRLSVSGAQFLI